MLDQYDDTATRLRCAHDAKAAAIRDHLLRLEAEGEAAGWNSATAHPRLFEVSRGVGAHYAVRWGGELNRVLDMLCDIFEGNVGLAIVQIAATAERIGTLMRRGADEIHDDYAPGVSDLYTCLDGYAFDGWGLRTEMWGAMREVPASASAAEVFEELERVKPEDHPDRMEARAVFYAARDGLFWTCYRRRGGEPVVIAHLPEAEDGGIVGNVGHGLTRLTGAIAANPVRVMPRRDLPPFWKAQSDGRFG